MLKVLGQVKGNKEFFELFPESIYATARTFKKNKYLLFPDEQAQRLNISKTEFINFIEKVVDLKAKDDQKITIIKVSCGNGLFALCEPLEIPPSICRVTSLEYSRHSPKVKSTDWAIERVGIKVPQGLEECLLLKNGKVYEGASSNFFSVRKVLDKFEVETAPDEVVLPGTIRKAVIESLLNLGIKLTFTEPILETIVSGFICSTSRFFIPISQVTLPNGSTKDLEIWGDFLKALERELLNVVLPKYSLKLSKKSKS
jgi:hypothetical protein